MRVQDVEDLKERMKRFGLAIIRLTGKLPTGRISSIIITQMVKSGTSAGANYRAACRARSKADFISKLGIVEEELDETIYWLEVSLGGGFLLPVDVNGVVNEGNELLAIVVLSIRTARGRS